MDPPRSEPRDDPACIASSSIDTAAVDSTLPIDDDSALDSTNDRTLTASRKIVRADDAAGAASDEGAARSAASSHSSAPALSVIEEESEEALSDESESVVLKPMQLKYMKGAGSLAATTGWEIAASRPAPQPQAASHKVEAETKEEATEEEEEEAAKEEEEEAAAEEEEEEEKTADVKPEVGRALPHVAAAGSRLPSSSAHGSVRQRTQARQRPIPAAEASVTRAPPVQAKKMKRLERLRLEAAKPAPVLPTAEELRASAMERARRDPAGEREWFLDAPMFEAVVALAKQRVGADTFTRLLARDVQTLMDPEVDAFQIDALKPQKLTMVFRVVACSFDSGSSMALTIEDESGRIPACIKEMKYHFRHPFILPQRGSIFVLHVPDFSFSLVRSRPHRLMITRQSILFEWHPEGAKPLPSYYLGSTRAASSVASPQLPAPSSVNSFVLPRQQSGAAAASSAAASSSGGGWVGFSQSPWGGNGF